MKSLSHTIYYADDDQDDLAFFEEAVCALPVRYKLYENGFDLLKAMAKYLPSLVFVDLNMPIITGFDVIEKIRANPDYNHIPTIALSTANDRNTVEKIRRIGANHYIIKPTSLFHLRQAISAVISIDWGNPKGNPASFVHQPQS